VFSGNYIEHHFALDLAGVANPAGSLTNSWIKTSVPRVGTVADLPTIASGFDNDRKPVWVDAASQHYIHTPPAFSFNNDPTPYSGNVSNGIWGWEGSTSANGIGGPYTDLAADADWNTSTGSWDYSTNSNEYRYYRFKGVSGQTHANAPWQPEFDFVAGRSRHDESNSC